MNQARVFVPSSLELRARKTEAEIATKAGTKNEYSVRHAARVQAVKNYRQHLKVKYAGNESLLRSLAMMSDEELAMQCFEWVLRPGTRT